MTARPARTGAAGLARAAATGDGGPAPAGPAVEVRDLTFRYPGAQRDSLTGVGLTIGRGDFTAVVGGNGSGKTTLCKTFNGLIPHFWSGTYSGEVRVFGQDTTTTGVAALSHRVGYVYQDFGNQLVRPTVHDEVSFGPVNFGLADWRERSEEALDLLGIDALRDRYTWQLSGGQQHLVALAGVLAMRPDLVVVDEPVAELDPARAEEIYRRLTDINRRLGTTVVVIEHHAEFIARYCKSVLLMADGAPVWHLPVEEAMARSGELAAHGIPAPQVVRLARAVEPEGKVPLTVEQTVRWLDGRGLRPAPGPGTPEPAAGEPATGPNAPAPQPGPVVASLRGVRHGYRDVHGGLTPVLRDVELELREGERIALVGGNGAGKSTLLRLLTGLKVPRSGTVEVTGTDTRTARPAQLAERVSYLYQRPEQMFLADSVRADIAMFPKGRGRPDTDELVDHILERVRLTPLADRDGRTLSGGQQRRATLGIGLAMAPALLLLDEPTSSLDVATRDDVIAMLEELADRIRCVVVATHDMHLVAEWATRVIALGDGRVLSDSGPAEFFADVELLERVHVVPPQITVLGTALGLVPPPLTVDECVGRLPVAAKEAGA
ncbi:energy-coupling factor ABC transporter ATP-binding protein [Streptomyces sp. WZ.A104]|uniref:ABC transporter ATP-binding protein n=1 Tax=Streptomyces sp. WZ.A104 TaxID=2023771 RepID=UPI000BBC9727|nr:ABC transporter ATP-binding protein [Streptomyces sp. WZ.A104]PCG84936.1 energy-coupling factor ABC transporter ATP-binding protein [Streptomyces sp. WZ.A104]